MAFSLLAIAMPAQQAERIQDAFQTSLKVDPAEVATKLTIPNLDRIADEDLRDHVSDHVNWAFSADHLGIKIKRAYPDYLEGTIIFHDDFVPRANQRVVLMTLSDFGQVPLLVTDKGGGDVEIKCSLEIFIGSFKKDK